jgi:hypothetical protein
MKWRWTGSGHRASLATGPEAATVELASFPPAEPMKSMQATEQQRFFALSTKTVDNSVHRLPPALRNDGQSSRNPRLIKKSSN